VCLSNGTHGFPRLQADLIKAGRQHSRKRVARLMREDGVYGKTQRGPSRPRSPTRTLPQRPDLINRGFARMQ